MAAAATRGGGPGSARGVETLLFANEAFYAAFAGRDLPAMKAIWADDEVGVSCLHPGWAPLLGRREVLESFGAIMNGASPPEISHHHATARLQGDVGVVVCWEQVRQGWLVATNLFVREGRGWRMFHHHASPSTENPPQPDEPERGSLSVN